MMCPRPKTPPALALLDRAGERFEETGDPCEWSEEYRPGGFHPINLGDTFKNGRYRVTRKLGYGSYSTVWLVVDNKCLNRNARYLAIKVMIAKQSSSGMTEIEIGHHLAEQTLSNPSLSERVALPLDSFRHVGPNGTHICLVYHPMGGTVASMVQKLPENQQVDRLRGERPKYPTWMAKRILKHTLSGLAFLHQNGVVHGDLPPGNLLFSTNDLDLLEEKELKQTASHMTAPLRRRDGKIDKWAPSRLMLPQSLNEYADLGPGMFIKISDLGAAFWSSKLPKKTVTPVALRAPEVIFDEHLSSAMDIWTFGCLIYELLTGLQLFGVWMMGDDGQEEADDDHLMELNDILEPLPDSWLEKWPRSPLYFGPNRERLNPRATDDVEVDINIQSVDEQVAGDSKTYGEDIEELSIDSRQDDTDDGGNLSATDEPDLHIEDDAPFINESLDVLFEKNKPADMSTAEAETVTTLIRQILQYDPSNRPTATELLEHPWFKD